MTSLNYTLKHYQWLFFYAIFKPKVCFDRRITTVSSETKIKLNQILLEWRDGEVHTMKWFKAHGISQQSVSKYHKSGLLEKLRGGAYIKARDNKNWLAAIYTAQKELGLNIHVEGRTALELMGSGQYISLGKGRLVYLASKDRLSVPIWIKENDWGVLFKFRTTKMLGNNVGLESLKDTKFGITVSSRERAILELIESQDLSLSFDTVEQHLEGLMTLRSELVQELLEKCTSVKVKRVFLFLSEKLSLPFFKKLNLNTINMGKGKRVVFKNGKLNQKYKITVPPG